MMSGMSELSSQAPRMFVEMQKDGVEPSPRNYVALLKACSRLQDLVSARRIHAEVVKRGLESDLYVGTMLVDVYAKCRSLVDARNVFERMPCRDAVSWNAMILGYAQVSNGEEALHLYTRMQQEGVLPHDRTYVSALKACSSMADSAERNESDARALKARCLQTVRTIHADIVKRSLESGVFIGNILVDAYTKCGSLGDARRVFEKMRCRDVVSWNAMILGYAQMDRGEEALQLYNRMQTEGVIPDARTYVSLLKACSSMAEVGERNEGEAVAVKDKCLETVRCIHTNIVRANFESDVFVGTMLVDVYSKCGNLQDARHVFERMPHRTVVSWNAMILAYAQMDKGEEALQLYARMQNEGWAPNDRTYVSALKACSALAASASADGRNDGDGIILKEYCLQTVRAIHLEVKNRKMESDVFVGNMLVDVYAKCGSLMDARRAFDGMPHRNVVSWTALIMAYAQMDNAVEALELYTQMQREGVEPNGHTYVSALKACSTMVESAGRCVIEKCLETVRTIHTDIVKRKLELHAFLGTMLVDVYAKCGSLEDARSVFEMMPHRDVVSWNAMIKGYAQTGKGEEALQLYTRMRQEGVAPDGPTSVSALKACSRLAELGEQSDGDGRALQEKCLETVRGIHSKVVREKLGFDAFTRTMLVDAYAKCGSLEDASLVFENMVDRDVVSWTAMISGFAQMGKGELALDLYTRMQQEGVVANDRTFVSALKACSSLADSAERQEEGPEGETDKWLDTVRAIHRDIKKRKSELGVYLGTMLVDAYAKCGSLEDARNVFDKMSHRDVVSWTAMILGYAQMDRGDEALHLYTQMQVEGVLPNKRTYVCALNACGGMTGLEKGKEIHAQIVKAGHDVTDSFVSASLIDMYGRCGSMLDAQQVFDAMPTKEIVAWNALIAGYVRQGQSEIVFDLFHKMKHQGIQPDGITFLGVLAVCSHVGLVDKGQKYLKAMSTEYGITPTIKHFTCMIDLLGRSGQIDRAMETVKAMPFHPDSTVWECVLGACSKWGDVKLGSEAFKCAVSLNKVHAAAYVLMSNICAAADMHEAAREIQVMRTKVGAWKQPGQSRWTDLSGVSHVFAAGDREHPECQEIYAKLGDLLNKMKKEENVPHPPSVFQAVPADRNSCRHSEKLAVNRKKRENVP